MSPAARAGVCVPSGMGVLQGFGATRPLGHACDYQECAPSVGLGVCTDLREGACVLVYLSCVLRGAASGARGQGPVPVPVWGWGRDTRAGHRQDRMVRAGVIDAAVEGVVCAV